MQRRLQFSAPRRAGVGDEQQELLTRQHSAAARRSSGAIALVTACACATIVVLAIVLGIVATRLSTANARVAEALSCTCDDDLRIDQLSMALALPRAPVAPNACASFDVSITFSLPPTCGDVNNNIFATGIDLFNVTSGQFEVFRNAVPTRVRGTDGVVRPFPGDELVIAEVDFSAGDDVRARTLAIEYTIVDIDDYERVLGANQLRIFTQLLANGESTLVDAASLQDALQHARAVMQRVDASSVDNDRPSARARARTRVDAKCSNFVDTLTSSPINTNTLSECYTP